MFVIRLPEEVEERLERLAMQSGRSKASLARTAIEAHLAELEDYYVALGRKDDPRLGLQEIERRIGVED